LGDATGNSKSQPDSFCLARDEFVEYLIADLRRRPKAAVKHSQCHRRFDPLQFNPHPAAGVGRFDGVDHQIHEQLSQLVRIGV
jgi:hypothetical protein